MAVTLPPPSATTLPLCSPSGPPMSRKNRSQITSIHRRWQRSRKNTTCSKKQNILRLQRTELATKNVELEHQYLTTLVLQADRIGTTAQAINVPKEKRPWFFGRPRQNTSTANETLVDRVSKSVSHLLHPPVAELVDVDGVADPEPHVGREVLHTFPHRLRQQ